VLLTCSVQCFTGEFGQVYKAHWIKSSVLSSHPAMPEIVAAKTMKGKLCTVIVKKNVEFRDGMGPRLGNGISPCFFAFLRGGI